MRSSERCRSLYPSLPNPDLGLSGPVLLLLPSPIIIISWPTPLTQSPPSAKEGESSLILTYHLRPRKGHNLGPGVPPLVNPAGVGCEGHSVLLATVEKKHLFNLR